MTSNDRIAHPAGAVGVVVRSPVDRTHAYRVKFSDGFEAAIHHDQLIVRKQTGPEKGTLDAADLEFHAHEFERLVRQLEEAHVQSELPETPSARPALNDLLVRIRLNGCGEQ
ncbi:nucleotidyltransferase domain-containing protein [Rhodopirellula islandica]|nr:nucleotidyltransferase domain-containing protein [Rhodopirellula islandica]